MNIKNRNILLLDHVLGIFTDTYDEPCSQRESTVSMATSSTDSITSIGNVPVYNSTGNGCHMYCPLIH